MFSSDGFDGHESVHFFSGAHGLRAVIAIHSTVRGPAAGGCRLWNYPDSNAMLVDALRLSRAMSYKSAIANLPLGGGKAVIWNTPETQKGPALFEAFGRAVESLAGRYWAAADVGVCLDDLVQMSRASNYISGLPMGKAASGDSAPATARGVFLGMQAAALSAFGSENLAGRCVAVQGVGGVGGRLCRLLAAAGARLIVSDIHADRLAQIIAETGAESVSPDEIHAVHADIFSPNALGGTVTQACIERLQAKVIAGAANNQLASPELGMKLLEAGIIYVPDYVINGGGIINLAGEVCGRYDANLVDEKLRELAQTVTDILAQSAATHTPTNQVADQIAHARLKKAA